jgi:transcriptional regulator with XRE-family HTH domain
MQRRSAKKLVELREVREQEGLSQAELAEHLGISQSTVSRRERKPPQRHSDASFRLCNYAETRLTMTDSDRISARKSFDEVWKKSSAHAAALSKIIEAFVDLCRSDRIDEEEAG